MSKVQKIASEQSTPRKLDALLNEVRSRRSEIETLRHVPDDIIRALCDLGLYRAPVPACFGGDAKPLAEVLRLVEQISQADASLGWVASFAPQTANYLGALAPHRLAEIFAGGPDVVSAGALFPLQPVKRVQGGLRVDGLWKFGSGSLNADWIAVGIVIPDEDAEGTPPPRLLVLPADRVEIVANWETVGLSGTGSHDLLVRDVVAEEDWSFVRGGPCQLDEPICQFPSMSLAALSFAVVGLGTARAALDDVRTLAGKMSITGAPRLGDRAYVQAVIAKAEVQLEAARALLYERVERAWTSIVEGGAVSLEETAMLRLIANHASRTSVNVTQDCFQLAGTTAIFLDNPLQRYLRDALVVNQHAFLGEGHYESAGRILLGGDAIPGFP